MLGSNKLTLYLPLLSKGLGRVALIASVLGVSWGLHLTILFQLLGHRLGVFPWSAVVALGEPRVQLLLQYCAYVVIVCSFHLAEYFITAIYNPSVLTADAFLISHSIAYTAAASVSNACFPSLQATCLILSCADFIHRGSA